jgi:hypothetical protein
VCRRFRDVADGILDREFRCLITRAESHLAALLQGDNALLGKPVQSGTGSTPPQLDEMESRELLDEICNNLRFVWALCYRPLFLREDPENFICSSTYFKVEIMDVTHRILKHVRSSWENEEMVGDVLFFLSHVHHWKSLLLKSIEPLLIQYIYAQSKSKFPDLFGSKITDLLECISDYDKDITVDIDSGGRCYIEGEYKFYAMQLSEVICRNLGWKPLTLEQQRKVQNIFRNLERSRNNFHSDMLNNYQITDAFRGDLYEVSRSLYHKDISYEEHYVYEYGKVDYIIFKVGLKCRKDQAPAEMLLELLKEQPYEDNEEESSSGAHTVQDPSPDLELKVQVEKGKPSWKGRKRCASVYKYLIRQKRTDS